VNFSCRSMVRWSRLRCCRSFCAASWFDQKSGAEDWDSIESNSACFAGTSKKPPELFDSLAQIFVRSFQILK
jgi:hypothetical protein